MAGILVVAHNALGESLVDCVKHVLGAVPNNVRVLSVRAHDDPQQKLAEGHALVRQLDKGNGVLILADIYGATPSNVARQLCRAEHIMGVAGVNLPMLVRAITYRNDPLEALAEKALSGGQDGVIHITSCPFRQNGDK